MTNDFRCVTRHHNRFHLTIKLSVTFPHISRGWRAKKETSSCFHSELHHRLNICLSIFIIFDWVTSLISAHLHASTFRWEYFCNSSKFNVFLLKCNLWDYMSWWGKYKKKIKQQSNFYLELANVSEPSDEWFRMFEINFSRSSQIKFIVSSRMLTSGFSLIA